MKEIKEDTNRWRNIPYSWIQRINIVKMSILPYQATNGILQRARTNNFTICMEIQKTSNSQSYLEKEEWNWRKQSYLTSGSITKPQLSRQYGTGTKTEILINGTK